MNNRRRRTCQKGKAVDSKEALPGPPIEMGDNRHAIGCRPITARHRLWVGVLRLEPPIGWRLCLQNGSFEHRTVGFAMIGSRRVVEDPQTLVPAKHNNAGAIPFQGYSRRIHILVVETEHLPVATMATNE